VRTFDWRGGPVKAMLMDDATIDLRLAMTLPAIGHILAELRFKFRTLRQNRLKRRATARAIRHLEGLPAYLLRDVGILDAADIAGAVGRGQPQPSGAQRRCAVMLLPHAT
jgi:hypothetical protein